MTLDNAVTSFLALVAEVGGIRDAPAYPPETLDQSPMAVAYPATGSFQLNSAGWGRGLSRIRCHVRINRVLLPEDSKLAYPFLERILDVLLDDPTLSGSVATVTDISWSFGNFEWGQQGGLPIVHFGWTFDLGVKQHNYATDVT